MYRVTLLLLGLVLLTAVPAGASDTVARNEQGAATEPEIDRSPIWARMYAQYLFFLGREMFWPDLDQREKFRLAVVNWGDLAEELGAFLEGRSIAGMPVELVALDDAALAASKDDFTVLFIGGTGDADGLEEMENALSKWNRRGTKEALIITDGRPVSGHDLVFMRLKEGDDLRLCVTPDSNSLTAKGLELPMAFAQRQCP